MKKSYENPTVTELGSIEQLTQTWGDRDDFWGRHNRRNRRDRRDDRRNRRHNKKPCRRFDGYGS